MNSNVHPNPCPVFPCSVCAGNATWRGRSVQCCTCSNWVHLKCSLLSFSKFRTLGSSHSWIFPPCFFLRSHIYQHCDFLLGLLQLVYLHCSIWPPSANASPAPHSRLQTSYPFSAHFVSSPSAPAPPPHDPGCFSHLLLLLPFSTPSGFFNGMLGVSEAGALNCYTFFRLIPLILFVFRNPKAVNRITSQSATCYHKIPLLFILHTRSTTTYKKSIY